MTPEVLARPGRSTAVTVKQAPGQTNPATCFCQKRGAHNAALNEESSIPIRGAPDRCFHAKQKPSGRHRRCRFAWEALPLSVGC
jgi:hypothetical protein